MDFSEVVKHSTGIARKRAAQNDTHEVTFRHDWQRNDEDGRSLKLNTIQVEEND
eukprot:m.246203 g.246203  ORF g.246203 m.246203 type:complete len:54 (+) comp40260_c2_seq1:198-359(+)